MILKHTHKKQTTQPQKDLIAAELSHHLSNPRTSAPPHSSSQPFPHTLAHISLFHGNRRRGKRLLPRLRRSPFLQPLLVVSTVLHQPRGAPFIDNPAADPEDESDESDEDADYGGNLFWGCFVSMRWYGYGGRGWG